jgi:hypothetical protein
VPREYTVVTPEPVTAVDGARAAAEIDPYLGLGKLWNGGGLQIATDDGLVLAIVRSTYVEDPADASVLLGVDVEAGSWLTEAYAPGTDPVSDAVVQALVRNTGGRVVVEAVPGGPRPATAAPVTAAPATGAPAPTDEGARS